MDKDVIIRVEGLGKKYVLGKNRAPGRHPVLREVLADQLKAPLRFLRSPWFAAPKQTEQEFWALRDLNFEVRRGEVLGVIGRNGAGKSTLLKILSRITEPTNGSVRLRGRVASLLEVGTGFHPELTGRENIYLNGAILGMRRAEIRAKFDEIVQFAEVSKFLDTPVKRYSSGMYVRLAFAVAAHLEPEVLIVDEVLAVGDAEFQRKCLGKMQDVAKSDGRTVLFVSHNLAAVQSLSDTGVLLEQGRLVSQGELGNVLDVYARKLSLAQEITFRAMGDRPTITRVAVQSDELSNGNLVVDVSFSSPFTLRPPMVGIQIATQQGTAVFSSNPRLYKTSVPLGTCAQGSLQVRADGLPLRNGTYHLSVWLGDWQIDYEHRPNVLAFEFGSRALSSTALRADEVGFIEWPSSWEMIESVQEEHSYVPT